MRIISGSRRGHKLVGFSGDDIRPTTDRVKESIFNLIQMYIPDSSVLDLFCGSGALACESLSRNAQKAVLVDINKNSIEIAKKNIMNLNFQEKAEFFNMSAIDYIKCANCKFDVIFLDPPYNKGLVGLVLKQIIDSELLYDDGIIMLESDSTDEHEEVVGLNIIKQKKYGRTYVTIYKK